MVLLLVGLHDALDVFLSSPSIEARFFLPLSLLLVPVVYATWSFGFAGAIATALWSTLLTTPNLTLWHRGGQQVAELLQLGVVNAVAIFMGQRVERERAARQRAQAADAAVRASEARYRGLFESSPVATLVVDPAGTVLEANPALAVLFGRTPEALSGMTLAELIGIARAEKLLALDRKSDPEYHLVLKSAHGAERWLQPTVMRGLDASGRDTFQILFSDMTVERHRQAGLRAYADHILRAQEEERKRIAQELHDDAIQALVLLCRWLDSLEATPQSLPSWVVDRLGQARRCATEVVESLRLFAQTLRPPTLDDLGLVTSIRRLLTDLAERGQVETRLKVLGEERRLQPETELGLFRIAQEALRNVERHSGATHIAVALHFAKDEVRLNIMDNGVGFIPPSVPGVLAASGKLGIMGMRERAELLGGKLEVESSPPNGTRVEAFIPIEELA